MGVVSSEALGSLAAPGELVNGVRLTRGALGLILSYHTLLRRIALEPPGLYVVAEDDARLSDTSVEQLEGCVEALERHDGRWEGHGSGRSGTWLKGRIC